MNAPRAPWYDSGIPGGASLIVLVDHSTAHNTMSTQPETNDEQPTTLKDRIFTVLWALGFLALGAAMIIWPDAVGGETEQPRKLVGKIIVWIWGRPGGIVVALVGLLLGWSAFTKSEKKQ